LGLFLLGQCSFKAPKAPQWDATLTIPLISRTFTAEELAKETEMVYLDSSGLLHFKMDRELDRYEVRDYLKIEGVTKSFQAQLGSFRIDAPGTQSIGISLGQIYPSAYEFEGQQIEVPPFSFSQVTAELPPFPNFVYILIASGTITLTIENNLPIPLSNLSLTLREFSTDSVIVSADFKQEVAPGQSDSRVLNFAGKRIPSHLKVEITGGSPGSRGEQVTIRADDSFIIRATISQIVATEAMAKIPSQDFSGSEYLAFEDSIIVSEAEIETGQITFSLNSSVPLNLNFRLTVPDFMDAWSNPLVIEQSFSPGHQIVLPIDLSGYTLQTERLPHGFKIHFNWEIQTPGTGEQLVLIQSSDHLYARVDISRLAFSRITGVLQEIQVPLDTLVEKLDLPEGLDSLRFESARVTLTLTSKIPFPVETDLVIVGYNSSTQQRVDMNIRETLPPSQGQPQVTSFVFDGQNSNIVELLNAMPDEIRVFGQVYIGDGSTEATIVASDFVTGTVTVEAPLSLSFPYQRVKSDVDTLELDEDIRDQIRDYVREGKLVAEIANHLPVGMEVSLYFSYRDTAVFERPDLRIGPLSMQAGEVDNQGKVNGAVISTLETALDEEQLQVFTHPQIFTGVALVIPGSEGQIVKVYGEDYVHVKAYAQVVFHVNPNQQ